MASGAVVMALALACTAWILLQWPDSAATAGAPGVASAPMDPPATPQAKLVQPPEHEESRAGQHADPVAAIPPVASEDAPASPTTPTPEERYAGWHREMLIDELHQLTKEFKQQSRPLFEARFASGQYEVLRADARLEPADKPEEELSQVRIEPAAAGGRVMKAVLSQQEFPELYDMKQRINWLMKHLHASGG